MGESEGLGASDEGGTRGRLSIWACAGALPIAPPNTRALATNAAPPSARSLNILDIELLPIWFPGPQWPASADVGGAVAAANAFASRRDAGAASGGSGSLAESRHRREGDLDQRRGRRSDDRHDDDQRGEHRSGRDAARL